MDISLSKWQTQVWEDTHRFRVVCSGRRSGKSTLSQLQVIAWANEAVGRYWIVCPTYKQAKTIHWEGIRHYVPQKLISKKNEVELSLTLTNGSVIELRGAENPDTLRGVKLRGLIVDEIASIRNWSWLWQEVLRPTLTDYIAPVLFISTPKGYNHFYELYTSGQDNANDSYKSWRFTSYDNPYISKEEIDHAKKELTEDTFAQEYLADFRKTTGLAYKPWNRDIHLILSFDVPPTWGAGRGFDYGSAHPTASVRIRIDPDDNWFVDLCYKDHTRSIEQHAQAILAPDYGLGTILQFGDPSGAQWFTEFSKYNLHVQPANKEVGQGMRGWVEHCVEKVNERLKPIWGHTVLLPNGQKIENAPRLFVLDKPENKQFVWEIENLKWRETATGDIVPVLDEEGDPYGHFDLMACMRYFAVSYKKLAPAYIVPKSDISQKNWSLT